MPFADVAFAAGFSSIRQFNDTVREVYAATPTSLRGRAARPGAADGRVELRLAVRRPYSGADLVAFLAVRAVDGVEEAGPGWYARTLRLPHGAGRAWLRVDDADDLGFVRCTLQVADLRDVSAAVERCRRLLDADCDPVAVDDELAGDPRLARLVRRRPGLRVPGHVDGHEVAVRAVLGQQVSVEAARRLAALLVERHGEVVDGDLVRVPGRGGAHAAPAVPLRGHAGRGRPGDAADAPGAGPCAGRALRGAGRRGHPAGPQRRPGRRTARAAGRAGDRPVDRGLRRAPCAR